jgi:hypothetical protein
MQTPVFIIRTLAAFQIKQFARDIGWVDMSCIFILHFVETTFPATVAQCFPLFSVQRVERLLPKGRFGQFT